MQDKKPRVLLDIEPIGKRIAHLRMDKGWTQQYLAERLAISRVAISHIEMGLSTPSERTVTLLAGLYKLQPHKLVEGTTYPQAKCEKLPHIVCFYTSLELLLTILENDLKWLKRLENSSERNSLAHEIERDWSARLNELSIEYTDPKELDDIKTAREKLTEVCFPMR